MDDPSRGPSSIRRKNIGLASIVAITFFNVCGGAFGSEEIVASCGPLIGLASIVLFSGLISLPIAAVTAELSTAFPNDGGYSIWVTEAFGEFWGVQESYWSLTSGIVDNAIYPVLIVDVAAKIVPVLAEASTVQIYVLRLLLAALFTVPNLMSLKYVGSILQKLCILVTIPFAIMIVLALPGAEVSRLKTVRPNPRWRQLISVLFWNLNGYDCISTCAGEIKKPQKNLPSGLLLAIVLVVLTYVLPLAAAVAWDGPVGDHRGLRWEEWTDGSFSTIATAIGGIHLGFAFGVAAIVGNCGMFVAELLEDSYQLYGMARTNLAPACFGRLHRYSKTPVRAILFLLLIIAVLIVLDFQSLLIVDNFFSCASLILEMAAGVRLRFSMPDDVLPRPYRVPLSAAGLCVVLSPAFLVGSAVLLNEVTKSAIHTAFNCSGLALGVAVYYMYRKNRRNGYQTPRLGPIGKSEREPILSRGPSKARTMSEFLLDG